MFVFQLLRTRYKYLQFQYSFSFSFQFQHFALFGILFIANYLQQSLGNVPIFKIKTYSIFDIQFVCNNFSFSTISFKMFDVPLALIHSLSNSYWIPSFSLRLQLILNFIVKMKKVLTKCCFDKWQLFWLIKFLFSYSFRFFLFCFANFTNCKLKFSFIIYVRLKPSKLIENSTEGPSDCDHLQKSHEVPKQKAKSLSTLPGELSQTCLAGDVGLLVY